MDKATETSPATQLVRDRNNTPFQHSCLATLYVPQKVQGCVTRQGKRASKKRKREHPLSFILGLCYIISLSLLFYCLLGGALFCLCLILTFLTICTQIAKSAPSPAILIFSSESVYFVTQLALCKHLITDTLSPGLSESWDRGLGEQLCSEPISLISWNMFWDESLKYLTNDIQEYKINFQCIINGVS